jgi:hypothetical protein
MIVGHAGLATHDMAATAATVLSLFAFSRWLDEPAAKRAAAFGAAYGFAVLCKFSCIGYVPAACLAMYLVRVMRDRNTRAAWRRIVPSFVIALVATLFVIWIGYAFHARTFIAGIRGLWAIDREGVFSYLFGAVRTTGWWWYFPAAVALKSTIASLLLALIAIVAARRQRVTAETLAAVIAILLVAMPSHLNLGVRYVLPLYAPLSIAAAAGALAILSRRRWIAIALLAWHTGASLFAHPDAFPYFNEAAARRPWQYLLDGNIDWGQDALRLQRVLRERKAERVGLAVMGWHDWDALGFPPHYLLSRDVPSQGWVAISETSYGLVRAAPWLEGRRYERIGKSIRLYYLE